MASGLSAVGDTHLYWEESGAGEPVVFVHGFTLDLRMWEPQVLALRQRYRAVRYDQRGFGRSDMPRTGVPYAHHEDLKGLLDHLGVTNAHVVGLSIGAVVALNFAIVHADAVRSLTLVDASGLDGFPFPTEIEQTFRDIGVAAAAGDLNGAKAAWTRCAWIQPALDNRACEATMRAMLSSYTGWHWTNKNPARPLDPGTSKRLAEVRAPTLVIVGASDLPYNHQIAETLARQIAGASHEVIAHAGHMANLENAEAFNTRLLEFLQRC